MNDLQHYNHLIIGQGLAGSLLAWQLITAGQRVLVIDNGHPFAASRVAAGLVNPVTGKRLVKVRNAEACLAVARASYASLGKQFGKVFLHDKPMVRLFDSDEIRRYWQKRRKDAEYTSFLGDALRAGEGGDIRDGFLQYQTGYLSVSLLLRTLRQWLAEQSALIPEQLDYAELQITEPVRWRDRSAKRVIFCEGAGAGQNPWFKSLPMQPAGGEILTLRTRHRLPQWIINSGQWLLPLEDGLFRLGATYARPAAGKPLEGKTTIEGKAALLKALRGLCPAIEEYKLISHDAGIRPNSRDKRPLIGFHPKYPRLAVFNGFGSRGSLLIPYYARHFADVLLNGAKLESDVDIRRVMS